VRRNAIAMVLALAIAGCHSAVSPKPEVAAGAGVKLVKVASLADPVGFTFTPNGRIVYLERDTGRVRLLNPATGSDRILYRFTGVNAEGERGALGVALHPGWPQRPFVYVYVSRAPGKAPLRNQLVRLRFARGRLTGLHVLLNSPIGAHTNHNGGRLLFGPDGRLYLVIGDGGADPGTAQDMAEVRGKILRLKPDGSVPVSNPIPGNPLWSFGHRNSIGLAFDPMSGNLWETENGPECNDEINLISKGGNFSWGPSESCSGASPGDTNQDGPLPRILPQAWFTSTIAITGAAFCDGCGLGAALEGDLIFGCANGNCVANVGPLGDAELAADRGSLAGVPSRIDTTWSGPIYSMEVAPNHRIYVSDAQGIYRLAPA
jgi:glucose/arabinose dehydrogenase